MHAEQFVELLNSPARLYRLPYAELESLVLEYPYAQNLRLLLFAKSWLEGRPDAENLLQKASLYSTDRRALYTFVQQLSILLLQSAQSPAVPREEDILELRPLPIRLEIEGNAPSKPDTSERQAREGGPQEIPLRKRKSAPAPPDQQEIRQKLEALLADSFPARKEEEREKPSFAHTEDFPAHMLRKKQKEEGQATALGPTESIAPLPKSRFASWREAAEREKTFTQRLNDLYQQLFASNAPATNAPETEMPESAAHSILDHEGLASETYAEILVRQGDFQTAIEVYRRLILKFPEKTTFFAVQIEKLKNSIS